LYDALNELRVPCATTRCDGELREFEPVAAEDFLRQANQHALIVLDVGPPRAHLPFEPLHNAPDKLCVPSTSARSRHLPFLQLAGNAAHRVTNPPSFVKAKISGRPFWTNSFLENAG
jgi:hypothetical protein